MKKIDESYFEQGSDMRATKVEDILSKNENILIRLKPNKKAYILSSVFNMMPFALIWLAFDLTFIIMMFTGVGNAMGTAPTIFIAVFMCFHLTPVWIWIGQIITAVFGYKNMEYVFTDKRIIVRSGLIGIDFKSIFYADIKGVNLKVGLADKIFKVGDIYVTAAEQSAVLCDINNPYKIMTSLQKITHDIKTDIHFPNDLRPDTNHGYNTAYKGEDMPVIDREVAKEIAEKQTAKKTTTKKSTTKKTTKKSTEE